MDIEKLIERLKEPDCDECTYEEKRECAGSAKCVLSGYAAEALSTIQGENEKLRAELELVKEERDAAVDCIYQIEDDLDRGNDNDWAREHIAEWESQKED